MIKASICRGHISPFTLSGSRKRNKLRLGLTSVKANATVKGMLRPTEKGKCLSATQHPVRMRVAKLTFTLRAGLTSRLYKELGNLVKHKR